MGVDKSIPIPLYYQLKQVVLDRIEKNIYVPGQTHLTEAELMNEFGLSRTTVRQTMSDLVNEGILERHKGIGTLILEKKNEFEYIKANNFTIDTNDIIETKLISFEIGKPDFNTIKNMNLSENDEVYILNRLRSDKNGPLSFSCSNIPVKYFPNLERDLEKAIYGLYDYIDHSNYPITTVEQFLETGHSDKKTASFLNAHNNTPIWILKNIAYSHSIPVEFGISSYLQNTGFRIKMVYKRGDIRPSQRI